jgi:rod shape-determining protein MreD
VSPVRIALNASLLFIAIIIQESVISRIHLPITGFSLYLAIIVSMVLLENRIGAVILGFLGGIILDLSPSSQSPFGQWALVLTLVAYVIAVNSESVDEIISRPVGLGLFVAAGTALSLALYVILGALLGESNGSFGRDVIVIVGNFFWTMLFAPFFMPILIVIRDVTVGARERI